jgi:peroxiredoxin
VRVATQTPTMQGSAVPKFCATSHVGAAVTDQTSSKYIVWFFPKADTGG